MAARRKVAKRPKAKPKPRKPLPIAAYVKRYGAPPQGHPRRAAYERSTIGKARAAAAAKSAKTRKRNTRERIRGTLDKWGRALAKARDLQSPEAWRAFHKLEQARKAVAGKKRWRAIMRRMLEERAEVFDIDADNYDVGTE